MECSMTTLPADDRLASLEAAVAALTGRLGSVEAQVHEQGKTFGLVSDVAVYGPLRDLLAAPRPAPITG